MNTGESIYIFNSGQHARAEGKPITSNPYSRNGSGAWLMWQAGWLLVDRAKKNNQMIEQHAPYVVPFPQGHNSVSDGLPFRIKVKIS